MNRIAPTLLITSAVLLHPAPALAQEAEPEHDATTIALQAGAGSHRGWNFASVAFELFPADQDKVAIFVVAGAGTIMVGAGAAYYTNRNGHGLTGSVVGGLLGAHVNLGGQLRLGRWGFLTGGVGYGSYFLQLTGVLPYLGWEYRI